MKPRKKREDQFLDPCAGTSHLSIDLIRSARQSLSSALDERRDPVVRLATTHHSSNAVASIILVTTALDVSMNEAIAMSNTFQQGIDRNLALHDTRKRFRSIVSQSGDFDDMNAELDRLVELRNEIVHHLPRYVRLDDEDCPEWIHALEERQLFVKAPESDFQFYQKISSYALAYWAWDVASSAVELFVRALPGHTHSICDYLVHNFALYRSFCPPSDLTMYDAEFGLSLTAFDHIALTE